MLMVQMLAGDREGDREDSESAVLETAAALVDPSCLFLVNGATHEGVEGFGRYRCVILRYTGRGLSVQRHMGGYGLLVQR